MNALKRYFKGEFFQDLNVFMPSRTHPYFGDHWGDDFHGLQALPEETRSRFLVTLFLVVLYDELLHSSPFPVVNHAAFQHQARDYFRNQRFDEIMYPVRKRASYPKFVRDDGRVNPSIYAILIVPVRHGLVDPYEIQREVSIGMPFFTRLLSRSPWATGLVVRLWRDVDFARSAHPVRSDYEENLANFVFHTFQEGLVKRGFLYGHPPQRVLHPDEKRP